MKLDIYLFKFNVNPYENTNMDLNLVYSFQLKNLKKHFYAKSSDIRNISNCKL